MADVVVLGSGCAGLVAALAAASEGANVVVLERSARVGGTTAVSGGGLWMPGAAALLAAGVDTPRALVREYMLTLGGQHVDADAVDRFLARAPEVAAALDAYTPARLQPVHYPDYHPELPGGSAEGHAVEVALFEAREVLGERYEDLRLSPFFPGAVTLAEAASHGGMAGFRQRFDGRELAARTERGATAMGRGLAAALYAGCLGQGVEVRTNTRGMHLTSAPGRGVTGVVLDNHEQLDADAVVLACGGFEWDRRSMSAFISGPTPLPASPPYNTGDGLRVGRYLGARLALMQEAWWYPVVALPDDRWEDGSDIRRLTSAERTNPHTIMVNRAGRRFCNESASYHSVGRLLQAPHASGVGWANSPAWAVFDAQHRRQYRVQRLGPGRPEPSWLPPAASVEGLARREGIDADGLRSTLAAFNAQVRRGRDADFGRGDSVHDRRLGDPDARHPCLGTVEEPPFYALRVHSGTIGTKGGLVVDENGAVLHLDGHAIPGLYAAGNTIANVTAEGYPGPGGTLGPAAVSGWTAGAGAARPRGTSPRRPL